MRRLMLPFVTIALCIALIALCIFAASGCGNMPDATTRINPANPTDAPRMVEDPGHETFYPEPVHLLNIPVGPKPEEPGRSVR